MNIQRITNFLNSATEQQTLILTSGTILQFNDEWTTTLKKFETNNHQYPLIPSFKWNIIKKIINDTMPGGGDWSGTKFLLSSDLEECNKTTPCPLCGECGSWKKEYTEKVHSKKNCPYDYLFRDLLGIFRGENDKNFYKFIMTIVDMTNKFEFKQKLLRNDDILNMKLLKDGEIDKLKKDGLEIIKIKDAAEYELALFHKIMPSDTIEERKKIHYERQEEYNKKIEEVNNLVLKNKKILGDIVSETALSTINQDMRNIKIKNLETKIKCQDHQIKTGRENSCKMIENLEEEKKILEKIIIEKNVYTNIETEGYEDMEKLNTKMYSILKEQKKIPDENCCFCQSEIVDECMTLKCGHFFHSGCYMTDCLLKCRDKPYLRTYACPLCRGESLVLPTL
tara:strand:- start:269 stop:1453 length:1185 start_codon:yes stop_codon:yes gene_type:complete